MFTAHLVFLVYLAIALTWNLAALGRRAEEQRRPWSRWLWIPLLLLLTAVLVRDRLVPQGAAWVTGDLVRHLFPLSFLAALIQNVHVLMHRKLRLTDVPFLFFNLGVGGALAVADLSLSGVLLDHSSEVLLYDYSVLQVLLGSPFAQSWTLCWHLPFLLRRAEPRSLLGVLGALPPASLAAFGAVLLVAFHSSAERVLYTFSDEARVEGRLPARVALGVMTRPQRDLPVSDAPGRLAVWVLPADHDGEGLPGDEQRPLVVQLRAPDSWHFSCPSPDDCERVFVDGAVRLAARLRPQVMLPFPEPDAEATLYFGGQALSQDWERRVTAASTRIREVSPETAIAIRLRGHGERSRELFHSLAPLVDIMGPRLEPGGDNSEHPEQRGAKLADVVLETWRQWRASLEQPPRWWILAAGCSPLAVGERAQERFLEGCLQRAAADAAIEAVLIDSWHDRGRTLGLQRPDGQLRDAGQRLLQLLPSQDVTPGR